MDRRERNRNRRERISAAINLIEDIKDQIEDIRDAEIEEFENLPVGIQTSPRGENMEQDVLDFDEVCKTLESATALLNEILER